MWFSCTKEKESNISGNFSASEYCNWRKKERVHHGRNIGEEVSGIHALPCLCILERNIERVHNGRNIDETELDQQKKHRTEQGTDISIINR